MFYYNSRGFRAIKNLLAPFPDKFAISVMYRVAVGKPLDWDNPRTLTAWINTQKTRDNAALGRYADKLAAKEIVGTMIGERYVTPVLWQGANPEEIPFASLPYPVVIKTNHGSGRNFFLTKREQSREGDLIRGLRKTLKRKHGTFLRERYYDAIEPRILVEPFLKDSGGRLLDEFNFYMVNGEIAMIQVVHNEHRDESTRKYSLCYYDREWNRLNVEVFSKYYEGEYEPPENLEELKHVAKTLSAPFSFVRVDLHSCEEFTRFGELTFMPNAGYMRMFTPAMDRAFFEMLGDSAQKGYLAGEGKQAP